MSESAVDIKVRAHVEIGEMRKIEDALQREIVQMRLAGAEADKLAAKEKHLGEIRQRIAEVKPGRKWAAAFGGVAEAIPGVSSFYTAFNGSMLGIAALGYGITKAFSVAGQSIRAFAASEVEMAKLDAALANSGQLTDAYREKLSKLASARSGKTGIDDEKYVGALTTLTKFGADEGNIGPYLRSVENLAGFMGGDLEQAAFIFGKAMQGSTEMLGRYGITVDKAKSQSEQLADIMRQLEVRGGGQLEAMASGVQGSINKMSNAWENMLESLGGFAEKSGLAKFLNWSAEKIQTAADYYGGAAPSGQENRTVLVGDTPEAQAQAEQLDARRKALAAAREGNAAELEKLKQRSSSLARPAMAAAAGMSGVKVGESKADEEARLAAKAKVDAQIAAIGQQNAALDWAEKDIGDKMAASGVRAVPQAEADKMAADRAANELDPVVESPDAYNERVAKQEALAAKREELRLDLAIAEARQRGDEGAEARLKWQKDYNRMLAEGKAAGMTPEEASGFADRSAKAGVAADKPAKAERDVFSAMRALGGARGENYSVQNEALKEARLTNRKLDLLLAKEPVKIDTAGRWG